MGFLDDGMDLWKYRNIILKKVRMIDLIQAYGVRIEARGDGQFTHRAPCPFHKEKTPSFFISDQTNTFCCFGCGKTGTAIDFVSFKNGIPPLASLTYLAKKAGVIDKDGKWDNLELDAINDLEENHTTKTIEPYLISIGLMLRNHIYAFINTNEFEKELRWMEKVGSRIDELLSNVEYGNWEYVYNIEQKVKYRIEQRKDRK